MGMTNMSPQKFKDYQNGGEGFLLWATENVHYFNRKERKWKPFVPWPFQIQVCKDALKMVNGEFVHRFVVFCWPRGESKSFVVCLIALWRFCCFPREKILLGANSRDQVEFVHFDVIKEHALNSPEIREFIGEDNIMERGIVLRREKKGKQKDIMGKDVISLIAPISTAHGIMSNITACTFSEMHKMKNETFYTELAGSIRAIRNGMALVDSTVAPKGHILERLYKTSIKGEDPLLYFSYYCDQHHNPDMTEAELLSYSKQLLPSEYNRHFRNRWEDASYGLFTRRQIQALNILGFGDRMERGPQVMGRLSDMEILENGEPESSLPVASGLACLPEAN